LTQISVLTDHENQAKRRREYRYGNSRAVAGCSMDGRHVRLQAHSHHHDTLSHDGRQVRLPAHSHRLDTVSEKTERNKNKTRRTANKTLRKITKVNSRCSLLSLTASLFLSLYVGLSRPLSRGLSLFLVRLFLYYCRHTSSTACGAPSEET
jgi:hypothetical protein